MVTCHSCHTEFEDYKALALHIMSSKTGHKKGRMWAAKFLANNTLRPEINHTPIDPDHQNTEYGDENRRNAVRKLSGENEYTNTHCPYCNKWFRQLLPVEYITSQEAWRNKIGTLIVGCPNCQGVIR